MKRIIIASLIAAAGIGTASADYQGESNGYQVNNSQGAILSTLPATAAGKAAEAADSVLPVGFNSDFGHRPMK